jgi:hypothetical protein
VRSCLLLVGAVVLGGCSFRPESVGAVDDAGARPDRDPGAPDANPIDVYDPIIDAGPCPEDLFISVQIDGVEIGGPVPDVLVGDSVRISANGTCVRTPPMILEWSISPLSHDILDTALGTDVDFTVYTKIASTTYVIDFVVRDGNNNSLSRSFNAFHTVGFQAAGGLAGNDAEIKGLDAGDGLLWLATKQDGFSMPVDQPGTFTDITSSWGGDTVSDDIKPVFYDEATDQVWFGDAQSASVAWQGDVATQTFAAVAYDGPLALDGAATAFVFAPSTGGLLLGTSAGVTTWTLGLTFVGRIQPDLNDSVKGIAIAGLRRWGGDQALYDLDMTSTVIRPFGGTADQKINALHVDATGVLWVASDDQGVARVDGQTGTTIEIFTSSNGLPSNKVRAFTEETSGPFAGDVWIATDAGLARWKADREIVIPLIGTAGLGSSTNLNDVAFSDDANDQRIFAGSTQGLVYAVRP